MHRLQVAVSVRACVCVGGGGFGVLAHCFSQGLWHLQQSRGLSFAGAICLLHALQAAAEQGLLQDPLPDWVRAGNELQGLVPALEIDGLMLTQSVAILEYLDETRGAAFLPADPGGRARGGRADAVV